MLLTLVACNKKNVTPPPQDKTADAELGRVEEKMYNVNFKQIKSSVNFLTVTDESSAKNFMPQSNLPPDSSLWVLEAALNYHFDKTPKGDHEVFLDTVQFSAFLTTLENGAVWVSPADLKKVYDQFKLSITQLSAGPKKVKIIDIKAAISEGQIHYKGAVILYIGTTKSNCEPFTTEKAAWSKPFMGPGFCCPATTLPDGPTLVAKKLNGCPLYNLDCVAQSWINVNSVWFDGWNNNTPSTWFPNSGNLFYYWKNGSLTVCNGICISLTAGHLNNYVSGCKALAATTPLTPGFVTANYYIGAYSQKHNNVSSYDGGWQMQVTYGKPVCRDDSQ